MEQGTYNRTDNRLILEVQKNKTLIKKKPTDSKSTDYKKKKCTSC